MNMAENLRERVLEFSRNYFAELESRQPTAVHPSPVSEDGRSAKGMRAQVSLVGDRWRMAAWPGRLDRGLPELVSPLAD
jgi:hypothetical protein